MQRSDRCRQTGRRARQYYGRPAFGRLILATALAALLALPNPSYCQGLLQIRIVEGEGAVNSAGSKSDRPLAVVITDETGRPVDGATVSFQLPEQGPSGVFDNSDRRREDIVITAADGQAAIRGIRWNRVAGPFQIRVMAAKNGVRAGAICSQYIADAPAERSVRSAKSGSGHGKWIAIAALVAGGAAAGVVAGKGGKNSATPAATPAPTAQPVQIGQPTITLGRP